MGSLKHILCGLIALCFVCSGEVAAVLDCPTPCKPYELQTPLLTTDWTANIGSSPWPEYPRPLLRRQEWMNLNGPWQFKPAKNSQELLSPTFGGCAFATQILVPFPIESGLSGIMENHIYSWYRRTFVVPEHWLGRNVLVNFGGWIMKQRCLSIERLLGSTEEDTYFRFTLDLTDALNEPGEENKLLVFVYDPTNSKGTLIPIGKQVLKPNHYFYTPTSGIWQTVFLKPVAKEYIQDTVTTAHADGKLKITVYNPMISSLDSPLYPCPLGIPLHQHQGTSNSLVTFSLPSPQLWSPTKPNLYHFEVKLGKDTVQSYFVLQTIEKKKDTEEIVRPFLNGEFVFQLGTLDQGFWPDGLYTAPTHEAMTYDLKVL
ncbi:uncharacterized protein PGTG_11973 [Puccinia graminis f. sp. tritici CRL 75-36-700-3]|uniref:Glycoside hydrolase family 2 immunoglobulin-like beta-sandwich domain-containing protein n=1 Tax=Puccinia graminis f. sp. tritici (strain CRL 75-36-700-3 / race SCCL) TaxID=418459 RepID=E3KNZ2_PUCGT|nr:uncharacterized protein PGTG_11973 [Puccinia graminis f. sp. tritici CRL 75-36-700-3]EFP86017.2 hypothetical protein PGTG_11973 [Puccinia graminis f. sp. tritici CRL 75-36-700-3]